MGSYISKAEDRSERFKVVIVGAGYAGITLASDLLPFCHVIIINPEEFFMHNAGSPRATVQPDFVKRVLIPLKTCFRESFIQAKVVGLDRARNMVILDSGTQVEYTHLVLATGTSGPFPFRLCTDHPKVSLGESYRLFDSIVKDIEKAERITCVGGGAVGVELAGEIRYRYPHKQVTLVHSSSTLCSSRLKPSAQEKLQSCIRRNGINLILDEKVSNMNEIAENRLRRDNNVTTESGMTWQADLVFKCIGAKPATTVFRDALGEDAFTSDGHIVVDHYFMVTGTHNIFAIGDITNISEEKMVVTSQAHATLFANNIKASLRDKAWTPYKPANFLMVIPVGKDFGVSQIFGFVFGDYVTSIVKGRELFVSKMWRLLKQSYE